MDRLCDTAVKCLSCGWTGPAALVNTFLAPDDLWGSKQATQCPDCGAELKQQSNKPELSS